MSEKAKLTFEELVEQVKDPAMLHALAAKHGLKIASPEGKKEEKKVERKMPTIEIPEDADMPTMAKALNSFFGGMTKYMEERLTDTQLEVKKEVSQSKQEEAATKVRTFAKDKKDFEKLIPFIEPYYNTGKYTIEEAYEMGKRASGETGKDTPAPKKEEEIPTRLSKTSESSDVSVEKAKPLNIRDAAKKNLDTLLKDIPLGDDPTNDDDKVD
jgi:hypothetical protein